MFSTCFLGFHWNAEPLLRLLKHNAFTVLCVVLRLLWLIMLPIERPPRPSHMHSLNASLSTTWHSRLSSYLLLFFPVIYFLLTYFPFFTGFSQLIDPYWPLAPVHLIIRVFFPFWLVSRKITGVTNNINDRSVLFKRPHNVWHCHIEPVWIIAGHLICHSFYYSHLCFFLLSHVRMSAV